MKPWPALLLFLLVVWALDLLPNPLACSWTQNDGFPTDTWGPCLWKVLHIMAANFPLDPDPERAQGYFAFFESLKYTLPCKSCRDGYTHFITTEGPLKLRPEVFKDRATVFRWLTDLHDAVNAKLHKRVPPGKDWYASYDALRSGAVFFF